MLMVPWFLLKVISCWTWRDIIFSLILNPAPCYGWRWQINARGVSRGRIVRRHIMNRIKKVASSTIRIVGGLVIGIMILIFALPLISKSSEAPTSIFAIVVIFFAALRNLFWSHPIIGFFLIFGLIAIIYAALQKRAIEFGSLQVCPHCRETIDGKATVCKFCQRDVA